ncbi:MAG: hypothetical protein DI551_01665 [Micavibrio aeruginosavorus]|uniref:Flagellar protein FlaG n=1 Tax=Micavibrio aeruginosavorus TaxID=349221 RepID=A0A2W5N5R9_9BACT|nr:MAG: hypothetical protein DI551_01665 [Micavibrio aeruginosavorus]
MLEAVNSVLSNVQYTRAAAEQQSVLNSYAANPERVQQATTVAPYISLYIKVDNNFDRAILQIRDTDTGDVVRQIPTETQLEAYRRAQTSNAVRPSEPQDVVDVVTPDSAKEDVPVVATSTPESTSAPAEAAPAPQVQQPVSIDTEA